ncbi:MAG TPA: hypothetical protein VH723_02325, partial [Candidatus Limnocylindrales bacterium]
MAARAGSAPPESSLEERPLSVGLRIVGQAAKRGLIPRLPSADALLGEVERWLGMEARETATGAPWVAFGTPLATLRTSLHPAATDVEFIADEAARLTVTATTAEAGPGYHTYLCQLLKRLGTDVNIEWEPADASVGTGDETGYFESGRRSDAETALLFWLRDNLQAACDARERGKPPVQLVAVPGHRFTFEGAIATALGPRDDDWLKTAVNDPRVAADVWPWIADAMDARYLLNRALVLMWTRVRWRAPGTDEERETIEEVLRLLRKAFPFDPDLAYPWREWHELLELSGAVDPMAERIAKE